MSSSPTLGSLLMELLEPAFGFCISLSLRPSPTHSLSLKNNYKIYTKKTLPSSHGGLWVTTVPYSGLASSLTAGNLPELEKQKQNHWAVGGGVCKTCREPPKEWPDVSSHAGGTPGLRHMSLVLRLERDVLADLTKCPC